MFLWLDKIRPLFFTVTFFFLITPDCYSQSNRIWATYYGETGYDEGHGVATDASGNVYLAGLAGSSSGMASGGFQNTYGGSSDAYLAKFDASGNRLWATYYGGTADDVGESVITDASGNVYLAGDTRSTSAIASGGFQNTYGGSGILGGDAFLVKFDAAGNRLWATYYGGTAADHGTSVAVDALGNVYLAGYTASTSGISSGGFQNVNGGGTDAYLVKFDPSGNRLWATYFGGTMSDNGYAVTTDASGNVYLGGYTGSSSGISSGGFQNTYGGAFDAFLVKYDPNGNLIWSTYYGGAGTEYGYCAATDGLGGVYFTGMTGSVSDIASGGFQNTYGGGNDIFLVKFDAVTGNRLWATYFGGPAQEEGFSVTTDPNGTGDVYIAGDSYSNSGIAVNGFQNTFTGPEDCLLAKFDATGNIKCATYFGAVGNDDDEYGHVAADPVSGNVYLSGSSRNPTGIASGGFQNTLGGNWDGFLVKFIPCDASLSAGINKVNPLCNGQCTGIATALPIGGTSPYTYLWNTGDTLQTINNLCIGTYTCVVKDSVNDSVVVSVTITEPASLVSSIQQVNGTCFGQCTGNATVQVGGGTPGYTYLWQSGGTNVTETNLCAGNDTVMITDINGCADTSVAVIAVNPLPTINAGADDTICSGESIMFSAVGSPGNYLWNTGVTAQSIIADTTGDYIVTVTDNNNCSNSDTVSLMVNTSPALSVSGDTILCVGESTTLTANGADHYLWSTTQTTDTIIIAPVLSCPITVLGVNDNECKDSLTVVITVNLLPNVDAPADDTICDGEQIPLTTASDGIIYSWSPALGLSATNVLSPVAGPDTTTNYTITVTDNNVCINTDSVNIVVQSNAVSLFIPTPTDGQLPLSVNFSNFSINSTAYEWDFGDGNNSTEVDPIHIYTEGGEYQVILIANNSDNCPDTSVYTFIKVDATSSLWIPNSFSPNDDGVNDLFLISTYGIVELEVFIYNRWGELIYKWNDITGGWDGKRKGIIVEGGVYSYVVKAKGMDSVIYNKIGHVSVIR